MGQSTNAILAYGYHLGGTEGWALEGIGEYGQLQLDWYDDENDDDFWGVAEKRLLAEIEGFTEEWEPGVEGYFDREREAKARLGVQFESHCSDSFPMFILATKVITVHRGSIKEIDPAELLAVPPEWDTRLRAALTVLGITPTQEQARWLLCSYWG